MLLSLVYCRTCGFYRYISALRNSFFRKYIPKCTQLKKVTKKSLSIIKKQVKNNIKNIAKVPFKTGNTVMVNRPDDLIKVNLVVSRYNHFRLHGKILLNAKENIIFYTNTGISTNIISSDFLKTLKYTLEDCDNNIIRLGRSLKIKRYTTFTLYFKGIIKGQETLVKICQCAWVKPRSFFLNILLSNAFLKKTDTLISFATNTINF